MSASEKVNDPLQQINTALFCPKEVQLLRGRHVCNEIIDILQDANMGCGKFKRGVWGERAQI